MAPAPEIDLVVLSRDLLPLSEAVQAGIAAQVGVRVTVHRVAGVPAPGDANRWETIARARNAGKRRGTSPWLMFLDDDVQLSPDAVARLHHGLTQNPLYAALAADYLGEGSAAPHTPHVAMGATLFRRAALELVTFRWAAGRCECQCCCEDLRRQGYGIRYWPGAVARHLPPRDRAVEQGAHARPADGGGEYVLAAFDRRHADKFRRQFLYTLRRSGNTCRVIAIGYGLYPSERAVLAVQPGVEVVHLPRSRVLPPVGRLRDFQPILEGLPPRAAAAYWDAGDVYFQGSLRPLWATVGENPGRLLAAREPTAYPENPAVAAWTLSILDPAARDRAFRLLSTRPFLNSGFAAGTAQALLTYCREAHRLLHSADLRGTTDWGDQTALNLYCHLEPGRWLEVDEGWNYCVHSRRPGETEIHPDGRLSRRTGGPVSVVHGNAHSLRRFELSWLNTV